MARKIDELLKLESYSEMDEEEIGMVIEYKARIKAESEEAKRRDQILRAGHESLVETANATRDTMLKAFDNACQVSAKFEVLP